MSQNYDNRFSFFRRDYRVAAKIQAFRLMARLECNTE